MDGSMSGSAPVCVSFFLKHGVWYSCVAGQASFLFKLEAYMMIHTTLHYKILLPQHKITSFTDSILFINSIRSDL